MEFNIEKFQLVGAEKKNIRQDYKRKQKQMIIVPIWMKPDERTGVLSAASSVNDVLQAVGVRVKLDYSEQRTPWDSLAISTQLQQWRLVAPVVLWQLWLRRNLLCFLHIAISELEVFQKIQSFTYNLEHSLFKKYKPFTYTLWSLAPHLCHRVKINL